MPLEESDRELISLLISQQIRDGLVNQRSQLVDEVVGQLGSD
jgi:hypothetical protein